jgi:hypothetical protein
MSSMKRSRTCSGSTDAQVDETERRTRSPALKIRRTIRTDDLSRLASVDATCSVASPQCDDARREADVSLEACTPLYEDAEPGDLNLGLPICDEPEPTRSSVDEAIDAIDLQLLLSSPTAATRSLPLSHDSESDDDAESTDDTDDDALSCDRPRRCDAALSSSDSEGSLESVGISPVSSWLRAAPGA